MYVQLFPLSSLTQERDKCVHLIKTLNLEVLDFCQSLVIPQLINFEEKKVCVYVCVQWAEVTGADEVQTLLCL